MTCYRSNNSPDDLRHAFARNDLLFTMSDNTRTRAIQPFGLRGLSVSGFVFLTDELALSIHDWHPAGGARRDRTDDLLLAKQALSQLSYGPARGAQFE
jgi:hypothetical protein